MEKESLRSRVFKNSLWSLAASLINKLGGLVFTIIIARVLMPESFGIYGLAFSIAAIFMTFADLGINQAMLRYVSSEINKNSKKAAAYFRYIFKIKLTITLIIFALMILTAYPLSYSVFNKPQLFLPLLFLALYMLITSLEGFIESLFYLNKVRYVAIKEFVLQFSKICAVLIIISIVGRTYFVLGAIWSWIISYLIALILVFYFAKKFFKELFEKSKIKFDKNPILKFIIYLTIGNLSGAFFSYIDIVILGIFVSAEYIGYYKAAFTLVLAISGLLSFVNIFLPVLTSVEEKKLNDVFNKILKYSFIITIPATFGLIFLAKYAIVLVYGYPYMPSFLPMCFLAPLIIFATTTGIFLVLMSAKEKTKDFAKLTLFVTFLNVFLNLIFIKILLNSSQLWAISGAAIATLISWIVYIFGAARIVHKRFKISVDYAPFAKALVASIVMSVFLFLFKMFISDMTVTNGIIEVLAGAIVYFAVLFLIKGFSKEDLELIRVFKK